MTNNDTTYENASEDSRMIHTLLHALIYPNIDIGYRNFVDKHYSTSEIEPPTTKEIQKNVKISLEGICFVYFIMMVDGWNNELTENGTTTTKKRGRKAGDKAVSNKKDMDMYVKQCKKIKSTRDRRAKDSWHVQGVKQAMQEHERKLHTIKEKDNEKEKSSSDEDEGEGNEELNFDGFRATV